MARRIMIEVPEESLRAFETFLQDSEWTVEDPENVFRRLLQRMLHNEDECSKLWEDLELDDREVLVELGINAPPIPAYDEYDEEDEEEEDDDDEYCIDDEDDEEDLDDEEEEV